MLHKIIALLSELNAVHTCVPVIISVTTGGYQAGGAKEEKVAQ